MKVSFTSALEQNLNVFQSERESFVKSRDWYRDQMHAVQEARSVIQQVQWWQELIRQNSFYVVK